MDKLINEYLEYKLQGDNNTSYKRALLDCVKNVTKIKAIGDNCVYIKMLQELQLPRYISTYIKYVDVLKDVQNLITHCIKYLETATNINGAKFLTPETIKLNHSQNLTIEDVLGSFYMFRISISSCILSFTRDNHSINQVEETVLNSAIQLVDSYLKFINREECVSTLAECIQLIDYKSRLENEFDFTEQYLKQINGLISAVQEMSDLFESIVLLISNINLAKYSNVPSITVPSLFKVRLAQLGFEIH